MGDCCVAFDEMEHVAGQGRVKLSESCHVSLTRKHQPPLNLFVRKRSHWLTQQRLSAILVVQKITRQW
jgi:hypothetical protein